MNNNNYQFLNKYNVINTPYSNSKTSIIAFLMDRIISTDNVCTDEELTAVDDLANKHKNLFGLGVKLEIIRQAERYDNFVAISEDERMIWEALDFVKNEFNKKEKSALIDISIGLAISDKYLDNKELSLIFGVVEACEDNTEKIIKTFTSLYEILKRKKDDDSDGIIKNSASNVQMENAVLKLINIISTEPKNVKLSVLGQPDPRLEGNIPPVLYSYEEFADWITIISLIRASRNANALINSTRVIWKIGPLSMQKGLIRYFKGTLKSDIDEIIKFNRGWCNAIKTKSGNVPLIDDQIFEFFIFGSDSNLFILDYDIEGVWKITIKRTSSNFGLELHAFDISGNSKTFWCPDEAVSLSKLLNLDHNLLNGNFSKLTIEEREREIFKVFEIYKIADKKDIEITKIRK
jgi:hypothetical protein